MTDTRDDKKPRAIIIGRLWADTDKTWEGYIDLGILGRVKCKLVHNDKRREGQGDSDLNVLVLDKNMPTNRQN